MQNTFSRVFDLGQKVEKKFYFTPEQSGAGLYYQVHINKDPELKKFKMTRQEGAWKIEKQTVKLPEWLFTLETQFSSQIDEAIASQK